MFLRKNEKPFVGDNMNLLAQTNNYFHLSIVYRKYLEKPKEEHKRNIMLSSGLVDVWCVLKICDLHEVVSWCVEKFDSK